MDEPSDEENYSSGSGVWIAEDLTISERAARDEERRLERRERRRAQRQESNAVNGHNAREPVEAELGIQRLGETASQLDVRNNDNAAQRSSASLDMEEERDLFLRLSLDGSA